MDQPTTPARYLKYERILEVSRMLNQAVELDALLLAISNYICELTLSEAGSVLVFEEETSLLKFMAAPRSQLPALKRVRVPLDSSVAGRAFTQGKPVIVHDALSEPSVFRSVDRLLKFQTSSILAVPILYGSHRLGVLEAVNKLNGAYSDDDVSVMQTLAVYTGIALFNQALMDEIQYSDALADELEQKKSDFVAITSHELRTPLGLIIGHAALLQEMVADPEQASHLDTILKSAAQMEGLIDQISSMLPEAAQKRGLHRRRISIARLIAESVAAYHEAASHKQIALAAELPEDELVTRADPDKVSVILSNLLENALNFTDSGGRVLVAADRLQGFIKVSVIDTGIGIPARDLPKIFDRFYQVESHATRRVGGLGLGLSVARVMVELHDGQIWAESLEGQGSSFTFLLPVS